jgi:predicted phage tail component-like protein
MEILLNDTYTLKDFGMICEPGHVNPLTPTFENKTIAIPGKHGLYNFGSEIRERVFQIPLIMIERDRTLMQHKMRDFISFLFDVYGKPKDIKLSFDYEPDKYYMIQCVSQIDAERVINTGRMSIGLVAYNPHAYSQIYSDEITWGNNVITFKSSYKLGHPGSDGLTAVTWPITLNVFVDGLAIKPEIEIAGSATNLVLSANGYIINIGTFTNNAWVIDCDKYTIKKDGLDTFISNLREFILLPGNNQISITGTGLNLTIRIKARDKYI